MLGYKLGKIRPSFRGFDYESDAILLLDLEGPYMLGTVFFDDIGSRVLVPVRAEYEDPKTGVIKAVTL